MEAVTPFLYLNYEERRVKQTHITKRRRAYSIEGVGDIERISHLIGPELHKQVHDYIANNNNV